jgi:hypothetical protein
MTTARPAPPVSLTKSSAPSLVLILAAVPWFWARTTPGNVAAEAAARTTGRHDRAPQVSRSALWRFDATSKSSKSFHLHVIE